MVSTKRIHRDQETTTNATAVVLLLAQIVRIAEESAWVQGNLGRLTDYEVPVDGCVEGKDL